MLGSVGSWSKWAFLGAFSCAALSGGNAHAAEKPLVVAAPAVTTGAVAAATASARPRIEVMFVLDTTGSMGGLIEGAKRKIWSIADELASADPAPELRVGLIAYRDRGDAYVTQRFDLTSDLDALYDHLHALTADGGGDEPESVNQALHEAVTSTQWSSGPGVYRTVFLVGDAPPHMDYDHDVPYTKTVADANKRGIVLNTVQCGDLDGTKSVWTRIAQRTQGTYAAIEQSGGMVAIAAPQDADIARLNAELADTVVAYGDAEQVKSVRSKASLAKSAPVEANAARLSYLKKSDSGVVTGGGDLVDDVRKGKVALEAVPQAQLPAELQGRSRDEQKAALKEHAEKRAKLQSELDQLVKARASYVKAEEKKMSATGKGDGFDAKVKHAVKEQAAAAAGLSYHD
ncbi:MAG TPA: vWA domain-containing protein [Polyangiales bacterium]|nr:vWA domain-containing protein [Polyangiales bacterium]